MVMSLRLNIFSYCNVGTNDSIFAKSFIDRNSKCANRYGIRDLPGQYQEWVLGRSLILFKF